MSEMIQLHGGPFDGMWTDYQDLQIAMECTPERTVVVYKLEQGRYHYIQELSDTVGPDRPLNSQAPEGLTASTAQVRMAG